METKPHSAEYFGETRDFWWNVDFLKLIGERLKLQNVRAVLDVGCGVGHWGRALAHVLPPEATLIGIDRERDWVAQAGENAERARLGRFSYRLGDACNIPFPDASFDLVTCQTLLIHLKDPVSCIREMLRVAKPGGLVLAVEPNNLSNAGAWTSVREDYTVNQVLDLIRLQLTCQLGKRALGLGFNSVGDLVPGYFAELGLEDIHVYTSDKATPLYPPYLKPEQRAEVEEACAFAKRDFVGWDREESRRYFLAGGGTEAEFEALWKFGRQDALRTVEAMKSGTFSCGYGSMQYLVAGRRKVRSS